MSLAFSQVPCHRVTDPEAIKALSDPLRRDILRAFCEPKTTKQIAGELGIKGNKLYHHVDLLESAGLLKLVETRPNRGTTERYLVAVAERFVVHVEDLQAKTELFRSAFEDAIASIDSAVAKDAGSPRLLQARLEIDCERMEEFTKRLTDLALEFSKGDAPGYGFVAALFPVGVDN